jgi:plasminogen activator/serine protease 12 (motopsin)
LQAGTFNFPVVLQEVEVPLVSNTDCAAIYGTTITTNMICAGDVVNGGIDSCQGDSGGPLMALQNNEYRQIGIVASGFSCAEPGFPGIYTRVRNFSGWIDGVINEGDSGGGGGSLPLGWVVLGVLTLLARRSTRLN